MILNKAINALITIGRKDLASFPTLHADNVPVKIDSGAYTSSMHCDSVKLIGNELVVVFSNLRYPITDSITLKFNSFKTKNVKSSNGILEERYFITLPIQLFNQTFDCQFSLTQRANMKHPVLLGRKFLKKKFIVDVSKVFLSSKQA
jgi:hypothetical protein